MQKNVRNHWKWLHYERQSTKQNMKIEEGTIACNSESEN